MDIKVEVVEQLGGTPYMAYAAYAWVQLIRDGLADDSVQLVGWDNKAVVALNGDVVVGIITYGESDFDGRVNIYIGYVSPGARDDGIYRQLWNSLVEHYRDNPKFREICGVTKVENKHMREVAKRLGRVEESVNLVYNLR